MGSIYRLADEVTAWVGIADDSSDATCDLIRKVSSMSSTQVLPNDVTKQQWDGLLAMLRRPYWSRVWVIQEIALARMIHIHCGGKQTTWKNLNHAVITYMLESTSSKGLVSFIKLARFHENTSARKPIPFLRALQDSTTAESTDPRDKVFSLFGLVHDSSLFVPLPNYTQSLRDIGRAITISAITSTSSLDIVLMLSSLTRDLEQNTIS